MALKSVLFAVSVTLLSPQSELLLLDFLVPPIFLFSFFSFCINSSSPDYESNVRLLPLQTELNLDEYNNLN